MNALAQDIISMIPRIDRGGSVASIDMERLGAARKDAAGRVSFSLLGGELTTEAALHRKMVSVFARRWDMAKEDKRVQDAASNFVTNGLQLMLPSSEDIRRGEPDKFLFTPGRGVQPLIPNMNKLPPGWQTNAYKIRERRGDVQWVNPSKMPASLPRSSYATEKKENGAEWYATSYAYSPPEEWEANALNEDLLGERSEAAGEAMDLFRERVSTWGDSTKKLPGFARMGDALLTLGGVKFSSGTISAVNMMLRLSAWDQIYVNNNQEAMPLRLLAPHSDRRIMQNTWFGTNQHGPSVWDRAVEQYSWLRDAAWTRRLETGSADGTSARWVLFRDDEPNNLYIEHTETMMFGPYQQGFEEVFILLRRHGGVVAKRPERVMYIDFTNS